jgi:ABC-type antimicrobial peptide transport system permease subunit
MDTKYFKGTSMNPIIDYSSRRERILRQNQGNKPSFVKKIITFPLFILRFLLRFFTILSPIYKHIHIKKFHVSKADMKAFGRQILQTLRFVALLFIYLADIFLTKVSSSKYFPAKITAKTAPLLNRTYTRLVNVLDRPVPGQITRLSLIDLSIRNLLAKKNRTNITIGGMAIGIGAIVFLVSIGYGLQQLVVSRVASLDELKQTDVSSQLGSKIKIDDKAINDFKQIPDITYVLPVVSVVGTVNYNNSSSDMAVYGVQGNYLINAGMQLLSGHYFTNNDLASILPAETYIEEQTAVLGASASATTNPESALSIGSFIQQIQFTLSPVDWVRVRQSPIATAPIIGYTRRTEGVKEGDEVWGGEYLSDDNLGKAGYGMKGEVFGKWVKSSVLLWKKQACDPTTQGDCEEGGYMVMRDSDNHQMQQEGYFAASNISLTGTSLAQGQVLGESASVLSDTTDTDTPQGNSIPFVNIASLSASLKPPAVKTVTLGNKAKKEAVVDVAMLNILGIKQSQAVGKTFRASFTATGDLLSDPSEKLQSSPESYLIVGVIAGDKTPLFYVPFIDLRSMGLTNYSQARIIVSSKNELDQVRRQVESKGFVTQSVADTVAQINGVFSTARTVLALLGFVALAVASLGMFNTLTVSLLERTREVGLMKSMGMKSEEVKELFLTESMIMSVFGGVIGLFVGFLGGQILSLILSLFSLTRGVGFIDISYLPLSFILLILGLSLLVGLVTGIYPARRATRISALNALRYE